MRLLSLLAERIRAREAACTATRLEQLPASHRRWFRVAVLNVSDRHVENLIARGFIKTVPNLGRSVRIAPAEARRFISGESAAAERVD